MSEHPQTIKRKIATLDQRSDEVKEVLGKAPSWVVQAGITVIFIVINIIGIVGSASISYNDVVSTPIVIGEKSEPISDQIQPLGSNSRISYVLCM
ncbi:hypothetical protein [Fulvivirga ligni]|uniref:hypothetical protein n=1 Tax=Fulvivirga ligni TaxID=2904246 RepID=UPI001F3D04B5|nr:hypothetical protein [Fulvivirga ligni]UII21621.1 hypothetical protein LVD16_00005 [Fulvivirga ligni]